MTNLISLFKRLFGSSGSEENAEKIVIDISGNGMNINGTMIDVPIEIDKLVKLFGKPRTVEFDMDIKGVTEDMLSRCPELRTKRINYAWDELGIYCYSNENMPVYAIGILSHLKNMAEYYPHKAFKGKLTINGKPWYRVMHKAEDYHVHRRLLLGSYSVVSGYINCAIKDLFGGAERYESLEFQRKRR